MDPERSPDPDLLAAILTQAFPFHLLVDGTGHARQVGPSLALVCPELRIGTPVADHLHISTPRATSWSSEAQASAPRGLVLVRATQGRLVLRGQLLDAEGGLLFLGAPWVTRMDDLRDLGLRLTDFAAADPVTDFVMLLGAQTSALADARLLAAQLQAAASTQIHQANHDPLTGLANRKRFSELLEQSLESVRSGTGSVAVVLFDLDRFKDINDTLGHQCGDRLLQQIGPRIMGVLRGGELVCRLGGDEFAVLVTSSKQGEPALADYARVARRIIDAIHEPFVVDELALVVEVSAGIAVAPHHGANVESLLQHADVAMYVAKVSAESAVTYSSALNGHNPRRLTLLAQLRLAMDRGELVLHFQPLLDLASNTVLGAEALVRWQHPDEGLLAPGEFVPLAESSGLIHRMTREVLAMACRQAKAWEMAGRPLVVSVNISARCLLDVTLPQTVADALEAVSLSAALLKLEITESAIISDPARAQTVIAALRTLGVALSIDDFGTGYTSLSYLRDLPIQELKLDRSFVTSMLVDAKNAVIVQTAVELAGRLGLTSVAEGVEDAATLRALAELGCDIAQGYHMARPMPCAPFDEWVAARAEIAAQRTKPGEPSLAASG